jgi:hypothetical protein
MLWQWVREAALERLRAEKGEQGYAASIREVVEG